MTEPSDGRVFGTPPESERADDPRFRTDNGVLITDGLRVWDYDWKAGTVTFGDSPAFGGELWNGWFRVHRDDGSQASMNGERLTTVHPSTRQPPPEPPT